MTYQALLIEKDDAGYRATVRDMPDDRLPEGNVTLRVEYSTINYKDGLAITGKSPVIRKFPLIAGIDCAGVVESSDDARYKPGDRVLVNGWGIGELHDGGLTQRTRMPADWLMPVPPSMTTRQAMAIGTAGYTAAMAVDALVRHGLTPASGDVLVTGAAGGVGSISVLLLAKAGFRVLASTGRPQEADFLKSLGAAAIISRDELSAPGRPLAKERWAGAVDSVGSHTLANVCASTKSYGAVAACGLAQGMDFPATVAPFILRGVTLYGIGSAEASASVRSAAWARLARDLDLAKLDGLTHEIGLSEAIPAGAEILAGRVRGRLVVDVNR